VNPAYRTGVGDQQWRSDVQGEGQEDRYAGIASTLTNNFHQQTGSPALGKGNATYNADLGAYTSDGKGNQH